MSERVIFHVDMDAFFASVEIRDNPALEGKPVLVGGVGRRGVVAAASYAARVHGCRSAQPMAVALRLCPDAIVLPPRGDAYAEASRQVFEVFDEFSPVVEGLSVDEAFLDMTGTRRLLGPPRSAAETLRAAIRQRTGGLTCSVGIASIKFISKIASAMNKPDGVTEVPAGRELEFLHPLPIGKLWGVGPKARERLENHGIRSIGDLSRVGESTLVSWFGEHGRHLSRLSRGVDERVIEPARGRKSLSHEDTYAVDVVGAEAIKRKLLSQATRVADRLVAKDLRGRRVQLKIRDTTFKTETRQCMLDQPSNQARVFYEAACRLLDAVQLQGRAFRLTGVGVGELSTGKPSVPTQLDLLDPRANEDVVPRGEQLQEVLSAVRHRFGHQALFPADAGGSDRPESAGGFTKTLDED